MARYPPHGAVDGLCSLIGGAQDMEPRVHMLHALTIEVEDYYQMMVCGPVVRFADWDAEGHGENGCCLSYP